MTKIQEKDETIPKKSKTVAKIESIVEETIEETKESLEKRVEKVSKRIDRYMENAEHDHDILMSLDRNWKEAEFLNHLLARKKTWLGRLFFRLFFK